MNPSLAVVMFCGPHDEGDQTPTRRIDHAISLAIRLEAPLFIAGDAFHGEEVERFCYRARYAGVMYVIGAYDSRHERQCTLSDAKTVTSKIGERGFTRLSRLHLVTDCWHMKRAKQMLENELFIGLNKVFEVVAESVHTGPPPPAETIALEQQGLSHYQEGTYGSHSVDDPLPHNPQPSH